MLRGWSHTFVQRAWPVQGYVFARETLAWESGYRSEQHER